MNITHMILSAKILSFTTRQVTRHDGQQKDAAAALCLAAIQGHAMTAVMSGMDREAAIASYKELLEAYGAIYDGVLKRIKSGGH